jgi:hypothetical protein
LSSTRQPFYLQNETIEQSQDKQRHWHYNKRQTKQPWAPDQAAMGATPPANNAFLQALTDAIMAGCANLAQAAPAAPVVAPVVAAVPGSACTPAQASKNMLDYKNNTTHAKIFTKATMAFPTTFSLAKPNMAVFLSELRTCAKASAWTQLMVIAINSVNNNFINVYGPVTLPDSCPCQQVH